MKITKEIAYLYLKYCNTITFTNHFVISDIYYEEVSPGMNSYPVIRCEYLENNRKSHKNIHVDLNRFIDWIKSRRENILDEILK